MLHWFFQSHLCPYRKFWGEIEIMQENPGLLSYPSQLCCCLLSCSVDQFPALPSCTCCWLTVIVELYFDRVPCSRVASSAKLVGSGDRVVSVCWVLCLLSSFDDQALSCVELPSFLMVGYILIEFSKVSFLVWVDLSSIWFSPWLFYICC